MNVVCFYKAPVRSPVVQRFSNLQDKMYPQVVKQALRLIKHLTLVAARPGPARGADAAAAEAAARPALLRAARGAPAPRPATRSRAASAALARAYILTL